MNFDKTLLPCLVISALPAVSVAQKSLNVIYIYADDMGKGMLSAYGQQQFITPNIDRQIRQGTSNENAYGCMLSAPARASLLTGYHDCHTDKWKISGGGQFLVPFKDTALIASRESKIDANDINLIRQHPQKAEELKSILLKECGGNLQNGINRAG